MSPKLQMEVALLIIRLLLLIVQHIFRQVQEERDAVTLQQVNDIAVRTVTAIGLELKALK